MKSFKYTILILTALFYSCGNNQKNNNEKLENDLYVEVMGIHDVVMPKMSTLFSLESQLKDKILALDSTDTIDLEKIRILENQISALEEADEFMMEWMRNFQADQESWPHDSVMSYLVKEKESISLVRDQMLKVISDSEKLLAH